MPKFDFLNESPSKLKLKRHYKKNLLAFYKNSHTISLYCVIESVCDFFRQPFLNLKSSRKMVDQTSNFTQANYFTIWQVSY